ncbi:uncharacterized protein LOC132287204 isoform X2 [Cornus florida]|uniref:uncharacterized protein LOC132287204 isoform X2 n=1 Tax=Cornus florida TaxID=4283 RepID=UPI00289FB8A3|nr:uncharacterized protein LOC132287204 isoform X2 [Cornus florida]
MADHLVLCVDRLITPESLQSLQGAEVTGSSGMGSCTHMADPSTSGNAIKEVREHDVADEEEPLIESVECRICQDEDSMRNMEIPCACSGSLKDAGYDSSFDSDLLISLNMIVLVYVLIMCTYVCSVVYIHYEEPQGIE